MASIPTRVKFLILTQALNALAFGYFLIYLTVYLVEINVVDAYYVGVILALETVAMVAQESPSVSCRTGRGGSGL